MYFYSNKQDDQFSFGMNFFNVCLFFIFKKTLQVYLGNQYVHRYSFISLRFFLFVMILSNLSIEICVFCLGPYFREFCKYIWSCWVISCNFFWVICVLYTFWNTMNICLTCPGKENFYKIKQLQWEPCTFQDLSKF